MMQEKNSVQILSIAGLVAMVVLSVRSWGGEGSASLATGREVAVYAHEEAQAGIDQAAGFSRKEPSGDGYLLSDACTLMRDSTSANVPSARWSCLGSCENGLPCTLHIFSFGEGVWFGHCECGPWKAQSKCDAAIMYVVDSEGKIVDDSIVEACTKTSCATDCKEICSACIGAICWCP